MDSSNMMKAALELLGVFILLVFLVYPLLLSGFNKLVSGFGSKYWRSLLVVVLTGIAASIVAGLTGLIFKGHAEDHLWTIRIVSLIVTALVGGGLLKAFVKRADGEPLAYSKTLLTCLLFGIVVVLIGMVLQPWQKSLVKDFKPGAVATQSSQAPAADDASSETAPAASISTQEAAPAMPASTPAEASSAS